MPQISFIQWKMMFMYLLIVYLIFVFILYFYINKKEVIIFKMDNNLSYYLKW